MTSTGYELPPSFQAHTGPMHTYLNVDLSLQAAPTPTGELIGDMDHLELRKKALQILFLPNFGVSDHIFRKGVDPSNTKEGFPTMRATEINGSNFSLGIDNNFNDRRVAVSMCLNGVVVITSSWSGRGESEEVRLDTATARWFKSDVLERVLSEVMSLPRTIV